MGNSYINIKEIIYKHNFYNIIKGIVILKFS